MRRPLVEGQRLVGGRKPKLERWQISYAKHARALRRALRRRIKAELSDAAIARRFGVTDSTLTNACNGVHTVHYDAELRRKQRQQGAV